MTTPESTVSTPRLVEWLALSHDERAREREACLDRIRALDPAIHAWVQLAAEEPIAEGGLHGIPFGAKDIIETLGRPTEYGSPLYKGRRGVDDAAIVRELRARGAVLLGKTHTTAFAYRTPAPTRNPHNLEHTPGGSSSGSAAAVAAGMVPFALGTQTQGSVIRPASFCGVAGFKPTYGVVPMDGVLKFAKSLDTLGFFTRTAADMLALWQTYVGRVSPGRPEYVGRVSPSTIGHAEADPPDPPDVPMGIPDPVPDMDPPMAAAFQAGVTRLRERGAVIHPVSVGDMLDRLNAASRVVMAYEAARFHEERYREHGDKLAHLADLVREGLEIADSAHQDAMRLIVESRERASRMYTVASVMLVPAAVGPAPFSLASTGDPRMNAPWTALGTPAISIPMGTHEGLPLGLQLTADRGDDERLLKVAVQVEACLAGSRR